jgi:hypothetical protein
VDLKGRLRFLRVVQIRGAKWRLNIIMPEAEP